MSDNKQSLAEGYIDGPDAWREELLEEIEGHLNDHDVRNITLEIEEERVGTKTEFWGGVVNKGMYGEDNPKRTVITLEMEKTGEFEDIDDQEQFEEEYGENLRPE